VAAGALPSSCSAIPLSVFLPYASVTLARSLPAQGASVSCEFTSAGAATIVILNMGHGSAALFSELSAATAKGQGVTITPVAGLGVSAFTISRSGAVTGADLLTARNVIISVAARLPAGQVQGLAQKLLALY